MESDEEGDAEHDDVMIDSVTGVFYLFIYLKAEIKEKNTHKYKPPPGRVA